MSNNVLAGYGVSMVAVQEEHLEQLRLWRNDPAISQFMLSREKITTQQQLTWYKRVADDDSQEHFVICYKGQPVGAANIKEQRGLPISKADPLIQLKVEPGIYLGDERFRNNVLAFAPSLLLLDYCFEQRKLLRLYATVHADNKAALNYNQKLGYCRVASSDNWVSIELSPEKYHQATETLKQFLSRRS